MTISTKAFRIMTLRTMVLFATLSINITHNNDSHHNTTECHHAESCHALCLIFIVMPNVVILNVFVLSVVELFLGQGSPLFVVTLTKEPRQVLVFQASFAIACVFTEENIVNMIFSPSTSQHKNLVFYYIL